MLKFHQLGGFVSSGEYSKSEMYYFRAIRSLAEYFNFGVLFRRHDFHGEIIWPEPSEYAPKVFSNTSWNMAAPMNTTKDAVVLSRS